MKNTGFLPCLSDQGPKNRQTTETITESSIFCVILITLAWGWTIFSKSDVFSDGFLDPNKAHSDLL